ncbi:pyruvate dehydrogenase complex dihydrolipoyllysine-residue acetyltransferase [Marinimicrobium agarilyticum]|uniref:pyruvate dehydrogenase complex dihydrolipoyllysine-residue acetyltransferase n=1 Tax=Marinimicrobium agarilyticum TaxID=306546 RepID=UPI000407448B|nr:pyruvate dehydrogenase complex dihydrolipoyllysine-residue acetyltransferase [Marinimicrobium agarilyticum]
MATETIKVPDIGGSEDVEVIEIGVAVGDTVEAEGTLVTLETDKASMDIPCPKGGKIAKILVKEGDKVSEGSPLVELESEGAGDDGDTQESTSEPKSEEKSESKEAAPKKEASGKSSSGGSEVDIPVPDIGGSEGVEVIEICVKAGDEVSEGDSLIVLETDKASMEIPSPQGGTISSIALKEGDKVSEGDLIGKMKTAGGSDEEATEKETSSSEAPAEKPAQAAQSGGAQDVPVPDIGGSEGVEVIEVCVKEGDEVSEGDSLIVLETDKASMEIPSPVSGKVKSIALKEGDKVSQGDKIGVVETTGGSAEAAPKAEADTKPSESASSKAEPAEQKAESSGSPATATAASEQVINSGDVYAGPAVRKLGRQLGVDLAKVKGSGPRGRVTKDDVRDYVKNIVTTSQSGGGAVAGAGGAIPRVPPVDFAKFGEIETVKMSKIKKLTADNMTRSWLNVPHVTQWDDVDITEMENFRQGLKAEAEKRGTKLTPLPFLLKACASALAAEPSFNVSLHHDGEHMVQKKYIHIGMAVDTPNGLVVPVIRDVDKKGLWELAEEALTMAKKARDGKLTAAEMQGGCFTISSLGAMGGSGFTPIVNTPEVGILGVSRAQMKPVWNGSEFVPRNMLPISLSYDHRAVNGADAGRFFTYLSGVLADVRRLLL